jgi:hypothetical protein
MRNCPFCQKADPVHTTTKVRPMGGYPDDPYCWSVRCEWCGSCGPEASTPMGAIAEWERRNNADKSA